MSPAQKETGLTELLLRCGRTAHPYSSPRVADLAELDQPRGREDARTRENKKNPSPPALNHRQREIRTSRSRSRYPPGCLFFSPGICKVSVGGSFSRHSAESDLCLSSGCRKPTIQPLDCSLFSLPELQGKDHGNPGPVFLIFRAECFYQKSFLITCDITVECRHRQNHHRGSV